MAICLRKFHPQPPTYAVFRPWAAFFFIFLLRFVSRYVDELNAPLFPFGYGLSYTTFTYSPFSLSRRALSAAAINSGQSSLTTTTDLTNSGRRSGTEVAQCYIRLTGTSVARPVRELRGFRRVELAPGQTKHIEFTLGRDELSFWIST